MMAMHLRNQIIKKEGIIDLTELRELQKIYMECADKIGDYKAMSKTELANGYCDADEAMIIAEQAGDVVTAEKYENMRSGYFAALMLRYWYKIFDWAKNSASLHLELEDFADWLVDSLNVAFYYRTWRYEYQAIVKHGKFIDWKYDENGERILNKYYYVIDPVAPDRIINRCCFSMRGRVYQFNNHDKRTLNVQSASLDKITEDIGDAAESYLDEENYSYIPEESGASILVKMMLQRDEGIEALILDGIAHQDAFKLNEEKSTSIFDARKLVKHLNSVDDIFMYDFCNMYELNEQEGNKLLSKLKSTNKQKLYKLIEKTKIEVAQTPELVACLLS